MKEKKSNAHPVLTRKLTVGQRLADKVTTFCGSWTFIISIFVVIAIWMFLNALAWIYHWDPYPFILLNFVLSCLAAMQAPIILMSQNRQYERDRIQIKYDYQVNRKAEREIGEMKEELIKIRSLIRKNKK